MTRRPPYSRAFCSRMTLLSPKVVALLRYDSGTHRTSAVRYVSHITRGIPCRRRLGHHRVDGLGEREAHVVVAGEHHEQRSPLPAVLLHRRHGGQRRRMLARRRVHAPAAGGVEGVVVLVERRPRVVEGDRRADGVADDADPRLARTVVVLVRRWDEPGRLRGSPPPTTPRRPPLPRRRSLRRAAPRAFVVRDTDAVVSPHDGRLSRGDAVRRCTTSPTAKRWVAPPSSSTTRRPSTVTSVAVPVSATPRAARCAPAARAWRARRGSATSTSAATAS